MRFLVALLLWSLAAPVWACTFASPELLAYQPDPHHAVFVGRVLGYVEDTTRTAGFEQRLVPIDSTKTSFRMVYEPTSYAWGVEYEVLERIQASSSLVRVTVFPSVDVDGGCRPMAMDRYAIQTAYPLGDTVLVVSNGRYQPNRPWDAESPSTLALAEDRDYDGGHYRQGVLGFSVEPFSTSPHSSASLQDYTRSYTPWLTRSREAWLAYIRLNRSDTRTHDADYEAASDLAQRLDDSLRVIGARGYVEMRRDLALLEQAPLAIQRRQLMLKLRRYWYVFIPIPVNDLPSDEQERLTGVNEKSEIRFECGFAYLVQRYARSRTERRALDRALQDERLPRVRPLRGCPAPHPDATERGIGSASF